MARTMYGEIVQSKERKYVVWSKLGGCYKQLVGGFYETLMQTFVLSQATRGGIAKT